MTALMVVVQAFQYYFVLKAQPSVVMEGLSRSVFLNTAMQGWYLIAGLVFIFSLWVIVKKPVPMRLGIYPLSCPFACRCLDYCARRYP